MSFGAIIKDETGNQSRGREAGAGIRIVDEIAHDDGVAHEDVRRDEAVLSEPKELSFNMLLC